MKMSLKEVCLPPSATDLNYWMQRTLAAEATNIQEHGEKVLAQAEVVNLASVLQIEIAEISSRVWEKEKGNGPI